MGNSGGNDDFDVSFADVIPDALLREGLYAAVLTDEGGRSWRVWRTDPAGSGGTISVRLPDLGATTALADGDIGAQLSAYSWLGLDTTSFFWADVGREPEFRSHSTVETFSQP